MRGCACEEQKTRVGARSEATKRCMYPGDLLLSSLTPFARRRSLSNASMGTVSKAEGGGGAGDFDDNNYSDYDDDSSDYEDEAEVDPFGDTLDREVKKSEEKKDGGGSPKKSPKKRSPKKLWEKRTNLVGDSYWFNRQTHEKRKTNPYATTASSNRNRGEGDDDGTYPKDFDFLSTWMEEASKQKIKRW